MNLYVSSKEDIEQLRTRLKSRNSEQRQDVTDAVQNILQQVKLEGDQAVLRFTQRFDRVELKSLEVGRNELQNALDALEPELLASIRKAGENIRLFHEKQKENSWFTAQENGILLGQKLTPLQRVGVYVPGGTAPLPSSVLMNVIPAKVAGVSEIILCTPPGKNGLPNPVTLACAAVAGVDRVFAIGGAQAVAAMAYGTQTVPRVDKITGPGNIYVATAKKMVFGLCGIDMVAGPSEILVIADEKARPDYIAADLLSQAEHDVVASSVLLCTSKELIQQVMAEIDKQVEKLPRKSFALESIQNYGAAVFVESLSQAVEISNQIAPEHLELYVQSPLELLGSVKNAGAIFLGEYAPEPLGDYIAGPNHILPTNGTARFSSPLGVSDFVKKSSVISYSRSALENVWKDAVRFAEAEGLDAHANAIRIRFGEEEA
ncbi:MAG: histidinol dehydrogenase [Ruminiclostridium sp.]|nr:histidinol dehydrogenase [Ruminiclostridium sp.]